MRCAELARAIGGANEALLIRRIRHWTLCGILPASCGTQVGTGRMRRYSQDTVPLARVLNKLAGWGLSIGMLKDVADYLATADGWSDASDAWLWIALGDHRAIEILTMDEMQDAVMRMGGAVVPLANAR